MAAMPGCQLHRGERALVYAMLGTVSEVLFTAVCEAARRRTRNPRLRSVRLDWAA